MAIRLRTQVPRAFLPLEAAGRYFGAYGGRGSGKSHYFAEKLVRKCVAIPGTHAVCIREVQKSLAQSAKRTIEGKIQKLGVGHLFDVQKAEIKTPGNGLIIFQGMQNHTAESIKSLESYDVAWVEEAQTLSATSLRLLRPTLRKPSSEIWASWNPRKKDDPVDNFFRGNAPRKEGEGPWELPPRTNVVCANFYDNPWFDETELVEEERFDFRRDRDTHEHVWLGDYEKNAAARVFKNGRVEWFEPPKPGTVLYLGADWGFSIDPTVLVACYIDGGKLYIWRERWALGLEIDRTPKFFNEIDPDWSKLHSEPNWRSIAQRFPITADSARPETISYMQRNGFPQMRAAIKGKGSVEDGIEFLRQYEIIIHPDCVQVAKEFARYSFKIDERTGEVTSILLDKENHTIDAVRYALENVRRARRTKIEELRI